MWLFHATPKKNLPLIKKEGLKPVKKPLSRGQFGQDIRSGGSAVYVFTNLTDAVGFAFNIEWALKEPVVIIAYQDELTKYTKDKHWQIREGYYIKEVIAPLRLKYVLPLTKRLISYKVKEKLIDFDKFIKKYKEA